MEKMFGNKEGAVKPSIHELESRMEKTTPIFDEYNELAIQYGYVVLFSSAFPLGFVPEPTHHLVIFP